MELMLERAYAVSLAVNILLTSVIFFPWVLPRETFSGFIGRKSLEGKKCAQIAQRGIDRLHFWEPEHCFVTAVQESRARVLLI